MFPFIFLIHYLLVYLSIEFNKTDEELKQMTDSELFEYLDAKALSLKQHIVPLSPYKLKRFAHISTAVANSDKGTDEVFSDGLYDSLKPIIKQNESASIDILIKKRGLKDGI
jgi:hypothetical protein